MSVGMEETLACVCPETLAWNPAAPDTQGCPPCTQPPRGPHMLPQGPAATQPGLGARQPVDPFSPLGSGVRFLPQPCSRKGPWQFLTSPLRADPLMKSQGRPARWVGTTAHLFTVGKCQATWGKGGAWPSCGHQLSSLACSWRLRGERTDLPGLGDPGAPTPDPRLLIS